MTDLTPKDSASAFPFPTAKNHPADAKPAHAPKTEAPSEDALDHGIEESFPASDPVSVSVTKLVPVAEAEHSTQATESVAGEEDPGAADDLTSAHRTPNSFFHGPPTLRR
jgi:hypothetical protein